MLSSSAPTKPPGRSHYRPGYSVVPAAPEAISSISSGLSIVGKIIGNGTLAIFGHVEGDLQASTVQISDGAQVEGNIVAEELTIGGRFKGTIHANRVKLNSTAVVEGDIFHRSLAIEENAHFEGMSRRQENAINTPSLVPANSPAGAGRVDRRQPNERRRTRRANAACRPGWRRSYHCRSLCCCGHYCVHWRRRTQQHSGVGRPSIHDFRRASN